MTSYRDKKAVLHSTNMMQTAPLPMFIKSDIHFALGGKQYHFENQGVSPFGITGIRWTEFDPIERVGEVLNIQIDVRSATKFTIHGKARLTAEISSEMNYLGMKFILSEFDLTKLSKTIDREGYYPTNYFRKYPRIPARDFIASMPLRAIAKSTDGDLIVFDIANMSPNGILLHSENPRTALLLPGTKLVAQVEPRGDIFDSFEFEGIVCRVTLDKNPNSKNISRFLGIRFLKADNAQKDNLLKILKTVLDNIISDGLVKK